MANRHSALLTGNVAGKPEALGLTERTTTRTTTRPAACMARPTPWLLLARSLRIRSYDCRLGIGVGIGGETPSNGGAEPRAALEAFHRARKLHNAHAAETALERALLSASAGALDIEKGSVAAAVRLRRTADDNGTTRLEVSDHTLLVRSQPERGSEMG